MTTDRLFFNAAQPSSSLADFNFAGYQPGATQFDLGNGYWEVTPVKPVPEPTTYATGLLALVALLHHRHRRARPPSMPVVPAVATALRAAF